MEKKERISNLPTQAYVYAEPELDINEDISAIDKADRRATIPARMKEIIIDGPAYCSAACPLNTNIPVPIQWIDALKYCISTCISITDNTTDR